MLASRSAKTLKNQQGLVLLVLVIVIVLAFASYTLSGLSVNQTQAEQLINTRMALKEAKHALIAYAVNYPEITGRGPGFLPCPDTDDDGVANPPCNTGGVGVVGRLPWLQINSGDIRDGSHERLWYAVTREFANFPGTMKLNGENKGEITLRNSNGQVRVDGSDPVNNPEGDPLASIVAVIIAPGNALLRDDGYVQNRDPLPININNPANYLDIAYDGNIVLEEDNATFVNASATNGFINGEIANGGGEIVVNDTLEIITYHDIMDVVNKRVAGEVAVILNDYLVACDAYPEASPFDPNKALPYDSAGIAPPAELREGHLPLDLALPTNWGGVCGAGNAPTPTAWLKDEGWHKTIYYAFAYQNAPPANGLSCGIGPNPACMTVNDLLNPINNAQALIVFAGRDITGGNRPSNVLSDYFENENNDLDDIYDHAELEDFIRVVTP